jgi:mannose-6-phosphate isomerase-like protein (cupin superfamily)
MMRAKFVISVLAVVSASAQTPPLAQRIAHYDPAKVRTGRGGHGGTGTLDNSTLIGPGVISGNLLFFQRGALNPHSSIGEHFHNRCEEMFIILDGEAEFTVDGRTSLIKGPAAVPDRMGHAHAIYNRTDKPVQWANVNVAIGKSYDAFQVDDPRVDVTLDKIPQFVNIRFDRALLKPMEAMNGGTGAVQYRRALEPTIFSTAWSWVDHLVIPSGASVGPAAREGFSEIYYVMAGAGSVKIGTETAAIKAGDAIPVDVNQTRSFTQTGSEPLEFLIVGVAKDMAAKEALMNTPPPSRGR